MTPSRVLGVRRLNHLFGRASSPIFVLDASLRLVYANPALEALTGQSISALIGLECRPSGLPLGDDLASLGGSLAPPSGAAGGHPCSAETLIIHTGGERSWLRAEFWPLSDQRGQTLGTFAMLRTRETPPHAPSSGERRLHAELRDLRDRLIQRHGVDTLIGQGLGHRRVLNQIQAASASRVPLTIVGEPGTGKRTLADTIHQRSSRSVSRPRHLDCAALPPEVLERTLLADDADNGGGTTVVLANVLELPRDLQARLAAILNGPSRYIATTPVPPDAARRDGRLRDDLHFGLTTLVITLQPLRERLEDVPLLAQHFLERTNSRAERRRVGFVAEAIDVLAAYDWPGNLRELLRVVEAAHAVAADDWIGPGDLPAAIRGNLASSYNPPPMPPTVTPLDERLNGLERRLIEQALARARQNKSRAAELLEISRPRLYRRIKELNIPDVPEPSDDGHGNGDPPLEP
jgi:transcriptional regulator with GAF, ATPase, and Fis domain